MAAGGSRQIRPGLQCLPWYPSNGVDPLFPQAWQSVRPGLLGLLQPGLNHHGHRLHLVCHQAFPLSHEVGANRACILALERRLRWHLVGLFQLVTHLEPGCCGMGCLHVRLHRDVGAWVHARSHWAFALRSNWLRPGRDQACVGVQQHRRRAVGPCLWWSRGCFVHRLRPLLQQIEGTFPGHGAGIARLSDFSMLALCCLSSPRPSLFWHSFPAW
mmetsp:Transcript_11049/g.24329  ORF Transcript_11049/g.24329 Transcript_11049/m.24329 type:complete len:215 (+) Transcript_11049:702-1346(+)